MKSHLLLGLGLIVASPLLLAQNSSTSDRNQNAATPAVPATPALPSTNSDDTDIQAPTTDDKGTTSGSARTKGAGVTGAANPDSGHGSAAARGANDFGSLDANGDGKLSRDEIRTNGTISGQFDQLDKNTDGSLSRAEFSSGLKGNSSGASTSSSSSKSEGSDKTKADDKLDRKLHGGG